MACELCENVGRRGPTEKQLYVDPFSIDEPPRFYTCSHCKQVWWCTCEWNLGFWTAVADRETLLAIINGQPVLVGNPTTKI